MLDVLASFYRDHRPLIAAAVAEAQRQHRAGQVDQHAEILSVQAKIAREARASPRDWRSRLVELRATGKQLATRRDELATELEAEPALPDTARQLQIQTEP